MKTIDLLNNAIDQGGCSAKLSPAKLNELLKGLPLLKKEELLVGTESCDDAAVWKIDDQTAIIQTTDFFPPFCSDPYTFGQIAAANALSDIYSMGGQAILALNLVMFPLNEMGLNVLQQILRGGSEKIAEAGAVLAGGHTIEDTSIKYGLAVTGIIKPENLITNSDALPGEKLILTKSIGTGTLIAGNKISKTKYSNLETVYNSMKQLNKTAAELMIKYKIKCATDITGFGLLGHCLEVARASGVTLEINTSKLPLFEGAYDLTDMGCIPSASFRNLKDIENNIEFGKSIDYNLKMLACDAQTSGGLLILCPDNSLNSLIEELKNSGYKSTSIIGEVLSCTNKDKKLILT